MAQTASHNPDVARARAGVITDRMLRNLRRTVGDLEADRLTDEGADLLLLCLGSVIDELIERRRISADACELMTLPANVIPLRGDA